MSKYSKYAFKRTDKVIKHNDVLFVIDGDEIVRIINKGKAKSIYIPCVFPSGETVCSIGPWVCCGEFNKVTISSGIKNIKNNAFEYAHINEVVWSESCEEIGSNCFNSSHVKKVSNIENVTSIRFGAFAHSCVEEIAWPDGCPYIPYKCFIESKLKRILNIDHVTTIGAEAFAHADDIERIDLSAVPYLIAEHDAFEGISDRIQLPYYMA